MKKFTIVVLMFFVVFVPTVSWAVVWEPAMETDWFSRFDDYEEDELRYVPDEIIIKYKEDSANIVEKELEVKVNAEDVRITGSLDNLNKKHKVQQIEPVFTNFKANQVKMASLLKKDGNNVRK